MSEIEGVSQLVNTLFQQALAEQRIIAIKAIELLAQAVRGDDGARPAQLGLAEDVFQNWNIEVEVSDGKQPPDLWRHHRLHALQEFGRVILLALHMIGRSRIKLLRKNL